MPDDGKCHRADRHRQNQAAEIGETYTETYTTTNAKGQRVTRTRTKTEWRPLRGEWADYVNDVVVTASRGIPRSGAVRSSHVTSSSWSCHRPEP